jgi:hypothetical protein
MILRVGYSLRASASLYSAPLMIDAAHICSFDFPRPLMLGGSCRAIRRASLIISSIFSGPSPGLILWMVFSTCFKVAVALAFFAIGPGCYTSFPPGTRPYTSRTCPGVSRGLSGFPFPPVSAHTPCRSPSEPRSPTSAYRTTGSRRGLDSVQSNPFLTETGKRIELAPQPLRRPAREKSVKVFRVADRRQTFRSLAVRHYPAAFWRD